MAGHNNNITLDPALIKYYQMHTNRWKYFRWTPRTTWITFAYVVAFPSFLGYWIHRTDGKWDLRGKRRGDTVVEF